MRACDETLAGARCAMIEDARLAPRCKLFWPHEKTSLTMGVFTAFLAALMSSQSSEIGCHCGCAQGEFGVMVSPLHESSRLPRLKEICSEASALELGHFSDPSRGAHVRNRWRLRLGEAGGECSIILQSQGWFTVSRPAKPVVVVRQCCGPLAGLPAGRLRARHIKTATVAGESCASP